MEMYYEVFQHTKPLYDWRVYHYTLDGSEVLVSSSSRSFQTAEEALTDCRAWQSEYDICAGQDLCRCDRRSVKYSCQYDATYCTNCNRWIERQCTDSQCDICKGRPARPVAAT